MAGHLLSTTFDHTSAVLSLQEISNVIEKNDLYLHGTQHVQYVLEVLQCMFVVHTGLEATTWSADTEFLIPSRLGSRRLSAQTLRHYLQQGIAADSSSSNTCPAVWWLAVCWEQSILGCFLNGHVLCSPGCTSSR